MTELWGRLRIDVVDDEIIVALPGTSYGVTYFKRRTRLSFSQSTSRMRTIRMSAEAVGLPSRAWRIANDKARELGWIV